MGSFRGEPLVAVSLFAFICVYSRFQFILLFIHRIIGVYRWQMAFLLRFTVRAHGGRESSGGFRPMDLREDS